MGQEFESWNQGWLTRASLEQLRAARDFARRASNGCAEREHKQAFIAEALATSAELHRRTGRYS